MLDDTDRRILRHLQAAPDLSTTDLAERAGVTTATCWRRLEKLTQSGVIKGHQAVIDWVALGYAVDVSLRITLDKTQRNAFDDFLAAAREVPEVYEIQTFLGRVDVRLCVLARDMAHYQTLYRSRILTLPHIADIESLMHIATIKTSEALPI
ncbi:Lrp/AsnC family transcriptional regulator [Pseudogemmobacter sp. W21_MBD1_M6]|uniref:Lrp/AsnC family transcriptional regulator n=1 Tax=Pseudogemmobacter sp. W21_MBD1_M6 TaxID=3240271 RepID=UPI003F997A0A